MMDPHSSDAHAIANVAWYLFAVGGAVVVAVLMAVLLVWRRSRRSQPGGGDQPPSVRDDAGALRAVRWLGVYAPVVVLVVTFGVMLGAVLATATDDDASLRIDIVGRQWFWDVTYPDDGVRTANEIHVPAGTTVRLHLTSADVIHSFWVPSLDRKIDLIPGRTNTLDLTADRAGRYEGTCAEFCGIQHANMRIVVIADEPDEFDRWLANQRLDARRPSTELEQEGRQILLGSACAYCHTVAGTNATGTVGPDLTHVGTRSDLAAGTISNTPGNLGGWLLDPQHIKPGNHMPGSDLSGEEVNALIAYLESLR